MNNNYGLNRYLGTQKGGMTENDINGLNNRDPQYVQNLARKLAGEQKGLTNNDINQINQNDRDEEYKGFGYAMNNLLRGSSGILPNGNNSNPLGNILNAGLPFLADLFYGNRYENKQGNSQGEFHDGEY